MNFLISYYHCNDPAKYVELAELGGNILADSGAFSAYSVGGHVEFDEYKAFCEEVDGHVDGYFNLDAIDDPEGSAENHARLKSAGLSPIPVWQSHDPEWPGLAEFLEGETLVALGGLKRESGRVTPHYNERRITSFLRRCHAINPDIRCHLLGYGKFKWLKKFVPYSVDTSRTSNSLRFGVEAPVWNPETMTIERAPQPKQGRPTPRMWDLIRYNFNYDDRIPYRSPDFFQRVDGLEFVPSRALALLSWSRYFRHIERRGGTRIYSAIFESQIDAARYIIQLLKD